MLRIVVLALVLLLCCLLQQVLSATCPSNTLQDPHLGWPNRCANVNEHVYYMKAPDHNGCGPRGFDQSPYNNNAKRCCRAHDICYSTIGATQGQCDQEFAACLGQHSILDMTPMTGLVGPFCATAYNPAQNDYLGCKLFETDKYYVGCFEDSTSRVFAYQHIVHAWSDTKAANNGQNDFTVQSCRVECASRKFKYAGLEDGKQCFCGNNLPASALQRPESQCNSPCTNDKQQLCGGYWRLSVYKTGYLGCFNDLQNRDLPVQATSTPRDNMGETGYVPLMCMIECQNKGYKYAGVQYGGYCFCGNTYGTYGAASESSCNMECDAILENTGNSRVTTSCGGSWANQVYDTQSLAGFKRYSFRIQSNWDQAGYQCLEWNGGLVTQTKPCSASVFQQFIWDGEYIKPLSNKQKCFDASNGINEGADIIVYGCNGQVNQRWVWSSGDRYKPASRQDLCMEINDSNGNSGIKLRYCAGIYKQSFKPLSDTINFDLTISNNQVTGVPTNVWVDVNPATNYAVGRGIGGWGCVIKTSYSKIYINRLTMMIDTSKRDHTSTVVVSGDPSVCVGSVPYGTAARCENWFVEVTSSIDLSGTPYRVISQFNPDGYMAHGTVVASNDGRTLTINGGGQCGWMATKEANAFGEQVAIVTGGEHIKVEMPRQSSTLTDWGVASLQHSYYDVQQQGPANDYCRYVGVAPSVRMSCAFAGSTNQYTLDYVDTSTLGLPTLAPFDCGLAYRDCGFAGDSLLINTQVNNFGGFNDAASSLKVAPGCTVKLCTDADMSGNCYEFKNNVPCLTYLNDVFSSGTCWC